MKRILLAASLLVLTPPVASAQRSGLDAAAPARPLAYAGGVLLTDQTGDALYLLDPATGESETLLRAAGSGRWVGLHPDGNRLGFKLIRADGLQAPAVFDIAARSYTMLANPTRRAGQVSFARDGALAFTQDDVLVVRDGSGERRFDLGTYANLAPISPDGRRVAFNDGEDQIWFLDLPTGSRARVTPGGVGCFNPQWSPDGSRLLYSRLDGGALVYDLHSGVTHSLGEGETPAWSPDGRAIVFVRKEIVNGVLQNSDLYLSDPEGRDVRNLTTTPGSNEFDPSFSSDGRTLLYHRGDAAVVLQGLPAGGVELLPAQAPAEVHRVIPALLPAASVSRPPLRKETGTVWLDIPYVHQVYDTPDWFNGHAACGPTTSIMLLAYWNVLPEWETYCSGPSYHVNKWGNYVSERYNFHWFDFGLQANDPNGRPAQGGYGFMWTGSFSPHSRMVSYYGQHGISATMTDVPSHAAAVAKIASAPYSLCNGLTTAGHIVLAHGVDTEPHTFIVNDPYGDKNRTDLRYPNYYGKNAKYDWPGYNNGNQNFNTVYWGVEAAFTPPVQGDTLVDDFQFQKGFFLNNRPPAGMASWKTLNRGYNGHLWYAYTTAGPADTCYAIWTPDLPRSGMYEVSAFISLSNATAATYKVNTLDGVQSATVNQKGVSENWLSLGVFRLGAGPAGAVRLGDVAPERGKEIVFDAIRWSYRGEPTTIAQRSDGSLPAEFRLLPNFPNPFNPSTTIRFELPRESRIRLDIVNTLGQVVSLLADGLFPAGRREVSWDAAGLPSGVYLARLRGDGTRGTLTRSMLLVK